MTEVKVHAVVDHVPLRQASASTPALTAGGHVEAPSPPWVTVSEGGASRNQEQIEADAREAVLLEVEYVRSHIASWSRALEAAAGEARKSPVDPEVVRNMLGVQLRPGTAASRFDARDAATVAEAPAVSARVLVGPHVEHLVEDLLEAERSWTLADHAVGLTSFDRVVTAVETAASALTGALRHALYLTFLRDAARARVGERLDPFAYCEDWGLGEGDIETIWKWIEVDGLWLGTHRQPLALDGQSRCVYRKPDRFIKRLAAATAGVWGAGLALCAVAALFWLLDRSNVKPWPDHAAGWKLTTLLVFVTFGAVLHIASRALNINYDSPIGVYDAGGIWDWLALRWLAVLRMYVPVAVVVACLWGAGSVPGSFQALGTAILAGYSADSFFRAGAERYASRSARNTTASPQTGS